MTFPNTDPDFYGAEYAHAYREASPEVKNSPPHFSCVFSRPSDMYLHDIHAKTNGESPQGLPELQTPEAIGGVEDGSVLLAAPSRNGGSQKRKDSLRKIQSRTAKGS